MPITESEKVLIRIMGYLDGKSVLDLGCGRRKIVPWATGVDDESESSSILDPHIKARVDPGSGELSKVFLRESFDVVFSSHTLEHIRHPILDTLRYWLSFVKPLGVFIAYLPDEDRYRYDPGNPSVKNPQHAHLLTPATFRPLLDQLEGASVEMFESDPPIYDHYSFLVVLRKGSA